MQFEKGKTYNRRDDLHNQYGGQEQGGISSPSAHDFIMLFVSPSGEKHGYEDGWANGHYIFTGEGQVGDMRFVRGNRAIRDHEANGKDIFLFERVESGNFEFIDQMRYDGHEIEMGLDSEGNQRKKIVFHLQPVKS